MDRIEEARALYVAGTTVAKITNQTGLSQGALYHWLAGGPAEGAEALPPIPLRRQMPARAVRPALRRRQVRTSRPSLVARLWRTAERQVAEIEARLVEAGGNAEALERDARTLGVLARTVRDLTALDGAEKREPKTGRTDDQSAEAGNAPRDLDAFRRDLAAKLVELGALEARA